jgi:hypothetical protein
LRRLGRLQQQANHKRPLFIRLALMFCGRPLSSDDFPQSDHLCAEIVALAFEHRILIRSNCRARSSARAPWGPLGAWNSFARDCPVLGSVGIDARRFDHPPVAFAVSLASSSKLATGDEADDGWFCRL